MSGIDVSHWNGVIDWAQAAADGVQFAYIKATQGTGEDPLFETNARQAQAAGILPLAYPFLTADDDDSCVNKFIAVVGSLMPAVLDWETAGVRDETVEMWVDGLGKRPVLAYYGIDPPDDITALIAACPRILPEYAAAPRLPAWDGVSAPDWSKEWLIWQSSDRATFARETGNFDLDQLAIDFERFKAWCATGAFPPA